MVTNVNLQNLTRESLYIIYTVLWNAFNKASMCEDGSIIRRRCGHPRGVSKGRIHVVSLSVCCDVVQGMNGPLRRLMVN